MAERASIFQTVQFGIETTPGVVVAANHIAGAMSIEGGIKANVNTFKPQGTKYTTITALGKEWSEAKISGQPTYTELMYPLAGCLCVPTLGTIIAGTAFTWTYTPSSTAADTVKTYTVEVGSATRAHTWAYGQIDSIGIKTDREKLELTGSMIGGTITDGITMTAASTATALVPVLPTQADVYLDTTSGSLGTTRLPRVFSLEWSLGGRFGPVWPINSSLGTFGAVVETMPKATVKMLVEADVSGMGTILPYLRNGNTAWLRINYTGGTIGGTALYGLTMDFPVKISAAPGEFKDQDGVYAIEYTFDTAHDATWGKAMQIVLRNGISTLA